LVYVYWLFYSMVFLLF